MKEFKLINENRGNEIIQELEDALNSKFNDMFAIPAEAEDAGCGDIHELEQRLTDEYEQNIQNLSPLRVSQSPRQLNTYLKYAYLTLEEAFFCLLGLDISSTPKDFSILKMRTRANYQVIDSVIYNTEEYKILSRAIEAQENTGVNTSSDGKIYTDGLINWAIDKFIEEVTGNNPVAKKTSTQKIKIPNARNYPEPLAKKLHKQLIDHGLISGEFSEMWVWIPNTNNSLKYLCEEFYSKFEKIVPKSGKYINITAYINKPKISDLRKAPRLNTGKEQNDIDLALSDLEKNYTK